MIQSVWEGECYNPIPRSSLILISQTFSLVALLLRY